MITYSSGNHAQGVARAARLLGAPCVVVMPSDAPAIKRERVAADGAEIVVVGTASDERQAVAERIAAERGLAIIPPFDDDRIIAGQGTVGLEIVEDLPDVAAVLIPIGGGGLASGVATAVRALAPAARIIGVEPELAADARDSLAAGEIVRWPAELVSRTIADGTRTQALGRRTFAHLSRLLDAIVTVTEEEIAPVSGSRPSSPGSSSSRRAPWASRRSRSGRPRPASRGSADRSSPSSPAGTSTRSGIASTSPPPLPAARSQTPLAAVLLLREPLGVAGLAGPDRSQLRRRAPVGAAVLRSSNRIQPARIAPIAAMNRRSPASHMIPPAICWSSRAVGPHGRSSVA